MDRTESIVRNMLGAIDVPLYDIGVLSDRGMLPGLDGITASAVLEDLPLLKYRNARGSHIYTTQKETEPDTMFNKITLIGRLGQHAETMNLLGYRTSSSLSQESPIHRFVAAIKAVMEAAPFKQLKRQFRPHPQRVIGSLSDRSWSNAKSIPRWP